MMAGEGSQRDGLGQGTPHLDSMPRRGFRVHLEEYRPLASTAESNIVEFLLSHPKDAVGISTHRLAELTYTSPSTVVRLARKLGFAGYRDLQQALVYDLAVAERSASVISEGALQGDSVQAIINKVAARNIATLELTRDGLDPAAIERAVDLLVGARHICLYGIGASLLVAHDLQLKLLRLDVSCDLSDDLHSQMLYARNTKPHDLAVVVSYSGMTEDVLHCVRIAKGNGATIISITRGSFGSPLVALSDVVLGVAATELVVRSGAMSSRIAQLNVVDVLFTAYVDRTYETSIERLSTNWIGKGQGPGGVPDERPGEGRGGER
ncbi:MurR/RpiR family transcriptional regulator [Olsenella sp. Marseille-P4559]|uniref:MurR/RpiR family transcriptional regulator n=1 Tax=Olsenella sp. Marseille-P4559 TaxID=2364795 RepID=UPI001A928B89|nr:MurR/RpiR family transcriptional regulator [Olsenella sp. Marseille-P4559]